MSNLPAVPPIETPERRARRLFDEMARNIGRETVNYMKQMYPGVFAGQPSTAELSMVNHIRNDINYRMRPLLMATIQMHKEWEAELEGQPHDPA
jgi:hypothetical protein